MIAAHPSVEARLGRHSPRVWTVYIEDVVCKKNVTKLLQPKALMHESDDLLFNIFEETSV